LSASSTVSGTGFSTYLASPPAIGGTAAAAGSFTALAYTTTLTGGTGIVNLGSGQFYKDASGNVGIGTTSPSTEAVAAKLALVGTAGQDASSLATSNTKAVLSLRANSSSGYSLAFGTVVTTNNQYIQAVNYNGGAASTDLLLQPYGNNVGIGTSSVTANMRLDVQAASSAMQVQSTTGTNTAFTQYVNTGGTFYVGIDRSVGGGLTGSSSAYSGVISHSGAYPLSFGTSGTERMRITSAGNLLLGATSQTWDEKQSISLGGTNPGTVGLGVYFSGNGYTSSMVRVQAETSGTGWKMYEGRAVGGSALYYVDGTGGGYFAGNTGIGTTSQIRSGVLSVSGIISTNNNINWGPAGNGRIFSDVNWGCIFQADRASPASADFLWQNSAGTTRLTIDTAGSLNLAGAYTEAVVAIGTVTTTNTISLASGTVQTATLTASTACTFTMPTATAGKSFVLLLKQAAATGNGTATFTSVKWGTAGAPTITATAGKMDILTFIADGTNWYGSAAQGYTP